MTVLVALILTPFLWLWYGFVFVRLWVWFIVPLGLPVVGLAQAIGVIALVGLLSRYVKDDSEVDAEWVIRMIGVGLFRPALYLAIGALAHGFMT